MNTKTVSTKTVGSIVRNAVGPHQYRTRGTKDFICGMEVQGYSGNVVAKFVNYSSLDDSYIDNKEQLLITTKSALDASGYNTIREGDKIRVVA